MEIPPPLPANALPAVETPRQNATSARSAAGPRANHIPPTTHSHPQERAPAILLAHRDAALPRPAILDGSPQLEPAQAGKQQAAGDQGTSTPSAPAPAARETLAFAANHADTASHTDVTYLHNPKPAYPPMARKLGLEGTVVMRILVNQAGEPAESRILGSSGIEVLDTAAMDAVKRWRFLPARKGAVAIAHWVDVPVTFKLGSP